MLHDADSRSRLSRPCSCSRPAVVPLVVAAALLVGRSIDVAQGTRRPSRLLNALGDSWFSLGPAVVLVLADSPAANAVGAGVLRRGARGRSCGRRARLARPRGAPRRGLARRAAQPERLDLLRRCPALAARVRHRARRVGRARGDRRSAGRCFLLLRVRPRARRAARVAARAQRGLPRHAGCSGRWWSTTTPTPATTSAASPSWPPRSRSDLGLDAGPAATGRVRRPAARRRQDRDPEADHQQARPARRAEWDVIKTHTIEGQRMLDRIGGLMRRVGGSSARPRALRRRRVPGRARRRRDPDRVPDRLLLRRLQRDDHRPPLPGGAPQAEALAELAQRRHPVRPGGRRRARPPRHDIAVHPRAGATARRRPPGQPERGWTNVPSAFRAHRRRPITEPAGRPLGLVIGPRELPQ